MDPLCGRGTTLSTALTLGHDACGVEIDAKAVEAYAAFLRTYLRRKRLKHSVEVNPVRREGRSLGRRLDVLVRPAPDASEQSLCVFTGDARDSAALYGKRTFSAIVTDAPYGVAHGSRTDAHGASGKRERSPAGLLREALPVWASQLRPGGALGLSWNTFGLSRTQLTELASSAGLEPLDTGAYLNFAHRVDSSINRDLVVARRPGSRP
jgi:tRNA G10  N-methylase Trm11